MIPNDPFILLSFVNTKLRDFYKDLSHFCEMEEVNKTEIEEKLSSVGFVYDSEKNQFINEQECYYA